MALQTNSDSMEMKAVGLSDLVEMCTNCTKVCWTRTSRIVENTSRAPRGWETIFQSVAEERRNEDNDVCLKFCEHVHTSCPEVAKVKAYEAIDFRKVKQGAWPSDVPKVQEMARCEHAVERFSNLLFTLAHKPSKVSFAAGSSPEKDKPGDQKDAPPTEAHRKVLQGGSVDDEIMKRWSTSRKGRIQMEEHGVLRTAKEAEELKQEMKQKERAEQGTSGTTPRW